MQRGEVSHLGQAVLHRLVDQDGVPEVGAAVDDPHADGGDLGMGGEERGDVGGVQPAGSDGDLVDGGDPVGVVQQMELEAARAWIDDEDRQGHGQPGQSQSATSGRSSPWALVHARAAKRWSIMAWRTAAARGPRPGTRSMTSITRW